MHYVVITVNINELKHLIERDYLKGTKQSIIIYLFAKNQNQTLKPQRVGSKSIDKDIPIKY